MQPETSISAIRLKRTFAFTGASLVPKGVDGVEARSLPRGIEAEDDADSGRYHHRCHDGTHRRRSGPVEQPRDEHGGTTSHHDAHDAAEKAEHYGLDEELPEDIVRLRADCHAKAYLPGPLGDGDEHDVHDAHPAHHEGDHGHVEEQL